IQPSQKIVQKLKMHYVIFETIGRYPRFICTREKEKYYSFLCQQNSFVVGTIKKESRSNRDSTKQKVKN
ncbi:MAG: hypothetical protein H7836_18405, partial [Magnetococcus sp. YQC-3]